MKVLMFGWSSTFYKKLDQKHTSGTSATLQSHDKQQTKKEVQP